MHEIGLSGSVIHVELVPRVLCVQNCACYIFCLSSVFSKPLGAATITHAYVGGRYCICRSSRPSGLPALPAAPCYLHMQGEGL